MACDHERGMCADCATADDLILPGAVGQLDGLNGLNGHAVNEPPEMAPWEFDDAPRASPSTRALKLTPMSEVKIRRAVWAWDTSPDGTPAGERHGRIPVGTLTIAAGQAGLGKSSFAVWLAARITKGTLPGHFNGTPRGVIYCATEDSIEMTIAPRLLAAGADMSRVFRVDVHDSADPYARLALPTDMKRLEAAIVQHEVALVISDPLLSMLDGDIDEYKASAVRRALEPMVAIADRTECVLLGIAHFNKKTGSDPLLAISGSGAFGQVVRSAFGFVQADDGSDGGEPKFVMSTTKNNLGRSDLPSFEYRLIPVAVTADDGEESWVSRFVMGDEGEGHVRDYLGDDAENKRQARDTAHELLIGIIRKYYQPGNDSVTIPADEVLSDARDAEVSGNTVRRVQKKLGGTSAKDGAGWSWTFPATALNPPVKVFENEDAKEDAKEDATVSRGILKTGLSPVKTPRFHAPEHGGSGRGTLTQNEGPAVCSVCGGELDAALVAAGLTDHGERD